MVPYWFLAMAMVKHVRKGLREFPDILVNESCDLRQPDYAVCIEISTVASLREMIKPGILVMGTPLFVGFLFGCKALAGVLIGALVAGVCGAIMASNMGGACDAKS